MRFLRMLIQHFEMEQHGVFDCQMMVVIEPDQKEFLAWT